MVTSSHRKFAEHALGLCNVLHRFDFVLTSEDVTRGKPSPDVYLLAAERLGIQPAEMLVLEDMGTGAKQQRLLVPAPWLYPQGIPSSIAFRTESILPNHWQTNRLSTDGWEASITWHRLLACENRLDSTGRMPMPRMPMPRMPMPRREFVAVV